MFNMLFECLLWWLSWLHSSWVFLLLEILSSGLSTDSSIPPRYKPLLLISLGFSWYLLIDSPIHQAKFFVVFVCLIAFRYLPHSIKIFYYQYLFDTSWSIELLFSIEAWYLLDLLSYVFYIYSEFNPVLNHFKYLDLSLFSLDLKTLFSPKTFSHSRFRPNPSLNPLVSVLNLPFLLFFMYFMHFVT